MEKKPGAAPPCGGADVAAKQGKRKPAPVPNEKQRLFLEERHKYVAFGGARGGGKSWAVRAKAVMLAKKYPGIRMLIVRRTYPELMNNHIRILRQETLDFAKYNDREKMLTFENGSTLHFTYCAKDADLDRMQGVEYDVIFLDEATQLSEHQMRAVTACLRGVNDFPKQVHYTCNPGGQGHDYLKRLFIDRRYTKDEDPDDYVFIQSLVTDNPALMKADPDYIRQLEALPPRLRKAWLEGCWDLYEGQFFEEFRNDPAHYADRRWTHVIAPFAPARGWPILRSYDFGYARPFSCGWWTVDADGTLYRILELYGCTGEPNVGVKWDPARQFEAIARTEREHPWLRGKAVIGVADPAIWDASRGESVAETAARMGVLFSPGDHKRIPGWMQLHYRLRFDENGVPGMYFFSGCRDAIRTLPQLTYSPRSPEDLDSDGEDHIADEIRYLCMSRPVAPGRTGTPGPAIPAEGFHGPLTDPLSTGNERRRIWTI